MKKYFGFSLIAIVIALVIAQSHASAKSERFDELLDRLLERKLEMKLQENETPLGLSGEVASLSTPTTTQATGASTGSLFVGSVLPSLDNQFDLGSAGNRWRNINSSGTSTFGQGVFNSVSTTGSATTTFAINAGFTVSSTAFVVQSGNRGFVGIGTQNPETDLTLLTAAPTKGIVIMGSNPALIIQDPAGGGRFFFQAVGGTDGRIGSQNNIPLEIFINNAEVGRFDTDSDLIWNFGAGSFMKGRFRVQSTGDIMTSGSLYTAMGQLVSTTNGNFSGAVTVSGSLQVASSSVQAWSISSTGQVYLFGLSTAGVAENDLCVGPRGQLFDAGGTTCLTSSNRFKHDIQDLDAGLASVLKLHPVSYRNNGKEAPEIGMIAEEMKEVEPRLVFYEADGVTPKGIKYEQTVALLVRAMQDQQRQIEALKKEIEAIKKPNFIPRLFNK